MDGRGGRRDLSKYNNTFEILIEGTEEKGIERVKHRLEVLWKQLLKEKKTVCTPTIMNNNRSSKKSLRNKSGENKVLQ